MDAPVVETVDCPQAGSNELLHWRASRPPAISPLRAHELTQPLTAIINSVNAAKRTLAHEDRVSLIIAQSQCRTEKPAVEVDEHHGWTCAAS